MWELDQTARAFAAARRRRYRETLGLAWHQAAWARMDIKLPSLAAVLDLPETDADAAAPPARVTSERLLGAFSSYQRNREKGEPPD